MFWEVVYKEGGTIPLPLKGRYTSKTFADKAIEGFLLVSNREQSCSQ